jgi:tyrosine-protein phosphatase SIW14
MSVITSVFILFAGLGGFNQAAASPEKFEQVAPGVYRSAAPTAQDLNELSKLGIHTVVSMITESSDIRQEAEAAKAQGLKFISVPIPTVLPVDKKDILRVVNLMNRQDLQPILVHCRHGEDRTGLAVGLYRVLKQSVAPEQAYQEMITHGFHPVMVFLKHLFEKITRFDP